MPVLKHLLIAFALFLIPLGGAMAGDDSSEIDLSTLQSRAKSGEGGAMAKLGMLYMWGDEIPADYAKAFDWFQKAVKAGNARGHFGLSNLYIAGLGRAADEKKAVKHLRIAADKGHWRTLYLLGGFHEAGKHVPKDAALMRKYWLRAAKGGYWDAMTGLGFAYLKGVGGEKDVVKALGWFLVWEHTYLGAREEHPEVFKELPPDDQAEAEKWAEAFIKKHLDP